MAKTKKKEFKKVVKKLDSQKINYLTSFCIGVGISYVIIVAIIIITYLADNESVKVNCAGWIAIFIPIIFGITSLIIYHFTNREIVYKEI